MKTSSKGLALLKTFEGLRTKAYRDGGGVWTIGFGHTAAAGAPIPRAGMEITAQDAMDILARDLGQYERGVSAALKRSPTQNQFDAMVSLCFNIGVDAFQDSSIVRCFNAGDPQLAAERFLLWNKDNGKVIPGLTRRREAEKALFLEQGDSPAPVSPVAPPTKPAAPPPLPEAPKGTGKPSIGQVMVGVVAAIVAAIVAYFMKG